MSKATKKAGDLAKATGGKKPPAAKAAPAVKEKTAEVPGEATPAPVEVAEPTEPTVKEVIEAVAEVTSETETEQPADQVTEEKAETETEQPADQVAEEKAETETEKVLEVEAVLKKRDKMVSEAKQILEIMDRCKVDQLYRNPKGEYFTVLNYAMLSVNQDRKSLQHYDRRVLKALTKLKAE
jgi:hypothetical protein